jgi:UDP-N-acetylglucosamine 4,6-dehydratase
MEKTFKGKNILITGGAGSFGKAIVEHILKEEPNVIRILDHDEESLFSIEQVFGRDELIRTLVGDIRDKDRLKRAVEGIDIIIHAAALKHVYSCEYNPFEAVKTNIIGTQNVIDAAIDEEVEKVMLTSTDKAANPTNVMGTSKLMGEKMIVAANYHKGNRKTIFSCVRFGNVIGSSGSVIPLFIEQLKRGGPVTITNPEMTRFVISMDEAVKLVTKSVELAHGGEVFILKMPAVRIGTLAEAMIEELSQGHGYKPADIQIKNIGIKAGEKMHEDLMTEEELTRSIETDEFIIILPQIKELYDNMRPKYCKIPNARTTSFSSKDARILSKQEIKELLKDAL